MNLRYASLLLVCLLLCAPPGSTAASGDGTTYTRKTVCAGGGAVSVNLVQARLGSVRMKVGLAGDAVGGTESLDRIAARHGAIAAINGTFFDAYTSGAVKNPHHTLITGGEIVHLGGVGTLIGFSPSSEARMERTKFTIEGSINGSCSYPQRWFAYWINRCPGSAPTITIFTPRWCRQTTPEGGLQVVVSNGLVTGIAEDSQAIPNDGFVIYFLKTYSMLHQKFAVGDRVEYRIVPKDPGACSSWGATEEALEAGPLLVRNGAISTDPVAEGFSSAKILSLSGARSAVGFTRDGLLMMVTTSCTVKRLAEVMKALGADWAMNLDGGASSSLWYKGKYVTRPGRLLSNALLVLPRRP